MKRVYFDDLESRLKRITYLESFNSYCLTLELKQLGCVDTVILDEVEVIIDKIEDFNDERFLNKLILQQPEFIALGINVLGIPL